MAAPFKAALALSRLIPRGRVLELCCGVGGLTRGLAAGHPVLAVDRDPSRLVQTAANLGGAGIEARVDLICCDLTRPSLRPGGAWAACVLDPDWSPPGQPPRAWASSLEKMRPPAGTLARWARGFSPRLALRLPPETDLAPLAGLGPVQAWPMLKHGREAFCFALVGDWPESEAVEL